MSFNKPPGLTHVTGEYFSHPAWRIVNGCLVVFNSNTQAGLFPFSTGVCVCVLLCVFSFDINQEDNVLIQFKE